MSMRATFTTEYIYDGADGYEKRQKEMVDILSGHASSKNMIGQISGIISGSDLAESDIKRWMDEQCWDLCKITIVPFRIVWLLEGGDLICKEVCPLPQL